MTRYCWQDRSQRWNWWDIVIWQISFCPLMLMPSSFYFGGKAQFNISRVCACRAIERFDSEARLAWIRLTKRSTKNSTGYIICNFLPRWHLFREWKKIWALNNFIISFYSGSKEDMILNPRNHIQAKNNEKIIHWQWIIASKIELHT